MVTKIGEQYQPTAAEIACDLWEFQHALIDAARANNDGDAPEALRRAVDIYSGDLLQGGDYPWADPARQDLHRRALDAHLRLAQHEQHSGHVDVAVKVLEKAIDLDHYAEEPHRLLMVLHATLDRPEAVTATWRLLHRRLGDLNLEVDAATVRLYQSLTETDAHVGT